MVVFIYRKKNLEKLMLRFIVAALWVVVFLIATIPLFLIELIVGLF